MRGTGRFTTPLFTGSALNTVNSSTITTALVPTSVSLHVSVGHTAPLVTAPHLASAIAQPTAGKVAEAFGARPVSVVGIAPVLRGGVPGGGSQNLPMPLPARVLIGLGSSCAYPTAMILIRRRATAVGMGDPPGGVLGDSHIAGLAAATFSLPSEGFSSRPSGGGRSSSPTCP